MDDTTARIKQAVDIVQFVGEYVRLDAAGPVYRGLCPFHDDHRPSFQVNPTYQNYRCWACGAKGDVFTFVMAHDRISFVEAKKRLAERAGIPLRGSDSANDPQKPLFAVLGWAQKEYQCALFEPRIGAGARQYLKSRGIGESTAKEHGLGYAPAGYDWLIQQARREGVSFEVMQQAGLARVGDRGNAYDSFRERLMFPIRDERQRVVGFGGRVMSANNPNAPKYLNTPATPVYNKSQVLYGIDVALRGLSQPRTAGGARGPRIIVVMEGYTDCLMAYQAGYLTAVATCGTALTPQHVKKLRTLAERVVLMFDADAAGQKAGREATNLFLRSQMDVRLCVLPPGQDPCDFVAKSGLEALVRLVESAPEPLDYLIDEAQRRHGSDVEGKRAALGEMLALLSEVPYDATGPQALKFAAAVSRVCDRFALREEFVRQQIEQLRQGPARSPNPVPAPTPAAIPMSRRERAVVELLVADPARAAELRPLWPAESVRHSGLRRLTEACYAVCERLGPSATADDMRELLEDHSLEVLLMELRDSAPRGDDYGKALADVIAHLSQRQRIAPRQSVRQTAAGTDEQRELALLRRLRDQNAF